MHIHQQKGFSILAVILVIVAVVVAIGVWALSGQTNTSNASNNNTDVAIAAFLQDSAAIKLAYDQLIINGANPDNIVFSPNSPSTTTAINVLDPSTGINMPRVSPLLINKNPSASSGYWIYANNMIGDKIGTNAADPMIIVNGMTDEACRKIAYAATGSGYLWGVALGGPANFDDSSRANPTTNAYINYAISGAFTGVTMSCFATPVPDNNVFFRILKAR